MSKQESRGFAEGLKAFHDKGFLGKPVRMNVGLAVSLLDVAEKMKDNLPEEGHERYCEAIMWIEQQVAKRYSKADIAEFRLGRKK